MKRAADVAPSGRGIGSHIVPGGAERGQGQGPRRASGGAPNLGGVTQGWGHCDVMGRIACDHLELDVRVG